MNSTTFGHALRAAPGIDAALEIEASSSRTSSFNDVEMVLAGLAVRAARGERVVRVVPQDELDRVEVYGIPDQLRDVLDRIFRLEAQQTRGAWFLPETVAIRASAVNLPHYFQHHARFAHTLASEERGKAALSGSSEAMVLWSGLEPLFATLMLPLTLRAEKAGKVDADAFKAAWEEARTDRLSLGARPGKC